MSGRRWTRAHRTFLEGLGAGLLVLALNAAPAFAQKPYLRLSSGSAPSHLAPGAKAD